MELRLVPIQPETVWGACQFLVLGTGEVVVGRFASHKHLWEAYCSEFGATPLKLFAAGQVNSENATVIHWLSGSFFYFTPPENQPQVERFFLEEVENLKAKFPWG